MGLPSLRCALLARTHTHTHIHTQWERRLSDYAWSSTCSRRTSRMCSAGSSRTCLRRSRRRSATTSSKSQPSASCLALERTTTQSPPSKRRRSHTDTKRQTLFRFVCFTSIPPPFLASIWKQCSQLTVTSQNETLRFSTFIVATLLALARVVLRLRCSHV